MKLLATIGAALAVLVPSSSALEPGPWKINLTGNLIARDVDTRVYALFNKPSYPGRLGTGFLVCHTIGRDFNDCAFLLRLGRGQLISRGVVPGSTSFRVLAITGGTGLYANVGGQLIMQPLGRDVVLILADLTAF